MSTSKDADDVLVDLSSPGNTFLVDLSSPGTDYIVKAHYWPSRETMQKPLNTLKLSNILTSYNHFEDVLRLAHMQDKINDDGKYCYDKESARPGIGKCRGDDYFDDGDQCQHQTNECKDGYLEVLLMVSSFLLSFATAGSMYFLQMLAVIGISDPFLRQSLAAIKRVFVVSFSCNLFGVLICVTLQSYHRRYKKFSLIISNTASFLFMVLGYGLLISFNIHRERGA